MRHFWLILVCAAASSAFCQSNAEVLPEVAHIFPMGNSSEQLGLNVVSPGDADTVFHAGGMVSDGLDLYVLDSLNERILVLSNQFEYKREIRGYDGRNSEIWIDSDYIVGGINVVGPDKFANSFYVNRTVAHGTPVLFRISRFLGDYDLFNYLCHIESVFYFQDQVGTYFGVDISGTEKDKEARIVLEDGLKKQLAASHNDRYFFRDGLLFDHDLLLSRASPTAFSYMSSLPHFDRKTYAYLADSSFAPLPNGRFLYTDFREIWIFETDGELLRYTAIENKPEYYPTSFCPAPDGYVYYLHPDFKSKKTIVYRLGPYPELMLGYGGTGGTINDDRVNVRERPDTTSVILRQVNKATPARILDKTAMPEAIGGKSAVWYEVRLWDRTEGWVFGAFVDVQK